MEGFGEAVNIGPAELETWLKTEESRESGWKEDGGNETIGHHSGRTIVEIKHKKKAELTDDDYDHAKGGRLCSSASQAGWPHERQGALALAVLVDELGPRPA